MTVYLYGSTNNYKEYPSNEEFKFEKLRRFIAIRTFIGSSEASVRELSVENAMRIFQNNLPVLIGFRNNSDEGTEATFDANMVQVYRAVSEKIMVMMADVDKEISRKIGSLVEYESSGKPCIRILDPNPGKTSVIKYAFRGQSFDPKLVVDFVDSYLEGTLLPFKKSEVTPTNKAPHVVLPLNANTFEAVTMDPDIDVMVIFYTTNACKLCEEIWPLYIKAAEHLKLSKGLRFTSINMAGNELDEISNIFYYPTLRYYPKDSKHRPYDYDQGLSFEDILAFIKRVASV